MSFLHEICDGRIMGFNEKTFFSDPKITLYIGCDGEIHNSEEVRNILRKKGYEFKEQNNNELISNAYKEWGEDCPKVFNGAFAFFIFDRAKRKLILVRDQVGRIPLYYSHFNGKFIFSSNLNDIIERKAFPKEIDLSALNLYLTLRYIPGEKTIFKNIHKVLPGSSVRYDIDSRNLEEWKYWEPPLEGTQIGNETELVEELETLLEKSVKLRLDTESNPAGFLSGGLDSSILVALMSKLTSKPVKTFIVGYSDKHYNETGYSKVVSDYYQTDHHELFIKPDIDHLIACIAQLQEPLADPSIIPTYHALRLANENANSVLSGDGADGLFLGFRTHVLSSQHLDINNKIPKPLRQIKGKIAGMFPEEHKLKIFLDNISSSQFFLQRNTVFNNVMRKKLLKGWVLEELQETINQPEEYANSVFESYDGTFSEKMGYFTYKSDPDDILSKIYNLSRDLDLHVRIPFLDTNIVEFALGKLPANLKLKGETTKYILKKIGEKYLPPELPLERKRGFNPPLSKWLRNEWFDFAVEILLDGEDGFFEKEYILRLLKLNKNSNYDQTRRLFSLLVFKIWQMNH